MDILFIDDSWQYPAITEKHAFDKVKELDLKNELVCYVAFPWATYIDLKKNGKNTSGFKKKLADLKIKLTRASYEKVITVCQHIRFYEFAEELADIGITDVFWSHKTKGQDSLSGIDVHPFPLYATQVSFETKEKDILFSFVGARSNQWYLTDIRNVIIDTLHSSNDVVIKGREKWHYNDIVYKAQVLGASIAEAEKKANADNTAEYLDIMARSKFALCPSGSGPNSIRLWECIEMGIIPVILADTYEGPEHYGLLSKFAIIIDETKESVSKIDSVLRSISEDEYKNRLAILESYKVVFGRDSFVTGIVDLALNVSHDTRLSTFLQMKEPNIRQIKLNTYLLTSQYPDEQLTVKVRKSILKESLNVAQSSVQIFKKICELKGIESV